MGEIRFLVLCATLCGIDDVVEVKLWGEARLDVLRRFLPWLIMGWLMSQEKLPSYLGFFELIHNARKGGKALLGALIGTLLAPEVTSSPQNP